MFCFYKCLTFLFEVDKKQTFAAVTTGSRRAHAYMHALEDFWEFLYMGKNPTAWTIRYLGSVQDFLCELDMN